MSRSQTTTECGHCGAFFYERGPHCPDCGAVPTVDHVCSDCVGYLEDNWVEWTV